MRGLALFLPLLIVGCDSTTLYTADLGQSGALPQLKAILDGRLATTSVTPYQFVAQGAGSLPGDWRSAQSLKIQIGTTFLPMATSSVGASPSFEVFIPTTLGFVPPLNGSDTMTFEIDNQRVALAQVDF